MALPPLLEIGASASPTSGEAWLTVQFTDASSGYTVIEETGSASDSINEASTTDTITEV
jgi:PKD repeat protein